ncbi:MAG: IS5 family transposase [Xanthomonadaceae bacterium]|jgi:transposase|nr:IS5 family transposase [Xanthomonadaceae bacterium]
MRSPDLQQFGMLSYISVETRVPADHPIRPLRSLVDKLLKELDPILAERYADTGRPFIPPERLLRAALLQVIYSVRSERLLMEQLNYNLLFRWFVGLNIDDPVWDHSTFSFNRDRLFDDAIAQRFFDSTVLHAQVNNLVSSEHFSVDGTLLEAWASHKSFRPKDGGGVGDGGDFRGERRSNETHESTTDPDARLARKGAGKESKLSYQANALMENRNGFAVGIDVRIVSGTAECEGALDLIDEMLLGEGCSVGADKGYDRGSFASELGERKVKPHIARSTKGRRSAVPAKVARTKGYAKSQVLRKRIESIFGWVKVIGGLRKLTRTSLPTVKGHVAWVFAAYNLVRLGGMEGWWEPAPT